MSNPRTEVILAPKIDRTDLNEVKQRMNAAFQDVSTKARRELENDMSRSVSDGLRKGGQTGLTYLKRGVAGVAAAVAAVAVNAFTGADEVAARMEQRLAGIRDLGKEAAAFGVSSGEYAQVASIFTSLGYDQSDVRGLLSGFQAELSEPEMARYKEIADQSGVMQSMLNFISKSSTMSQTERAAFLKPLGDEDSVIASAIASLMVKTDSNNLQSLFSASTGLNDTAAQLTKAIQKGEIESDELNRYFGANLIRDIKLGGDAGQVKQSLDLDRAVNEAHDAAMTEKLITKSLMISAEIASIEAAQVTVTGTDAWFNRAENVITNFDEELGKTVNMGGSDILNYKPWDTDPDRQKNDLLDFLFRGVVWDWFESSNRNDNQQSYGDTQ